MTKKGVNMAVPLIPFIVMIGGVAVKYATKKLAQQAAKNIGGRYVSKPSKELIDKAVSPRSALKNNPTLADKIKANIGIPPKQSKSMPLVGRTSDKAGVDVGKLAQLAKKRRVQIGTGVPLVALTGKVAYEIGKEAKESSKKGDAQADTVKDKEKKKKPIPKLTKDDMPKPRPKKKMYMKERSGKDSKVEFEAVKGSVGLNATKKDLKPVPVGKKGKGLSMLDKSVRNNMGFMYGGGMPMPSKKPRMSNTDYRKASKGMLLIAINMKKKKGKGKKA
jgi:hypothetical protein